MKKKDTVTSAVLSEDYRSNLALVTRLLRTSDSFDMLTKTLVLESGELTLFFIDGFAKDTVLQKLMMHFTSLKKLRHTAREFMEECLPYIETDVTADLSQMLHMVMSGGTLILGSSFGAEAILLDTRTYPARQTAEPEGDRVMRGSRDGFVETLIFNTALIRRRIRNPELTMQYFKIGRDSGSDVVLCYMNDRADKEYVKELSKKLSSIDTDALVMGHESLKECLVKHRWYNPFPKIRTTERPDAAAAQLLEGSVLIIIDNSPEVMVLPSTIFDFMQESNDFYFPPLTGTYIRIVRYVVFFLTLVLTPTWYLMLRYPNFVPAWLGFVLPKETGQLPIFVQLLLVEFIIDALRLASLNTPNMLNNSLSVVGGLILGDFAVDIGWLIPEVILYMAFVAIANFTQRSYELGYSIKFLRILLLVLTALFGIWGYAGGMLVIIILIATNSTANGKRNYLYPLIPLDLRALRTLLFRVKKSS
ncbi:MAG: spore germination protein [Ruminococcaceae bacterium]|nr:spore germination protein [Oscillospiraceae bacterium]